MQTATTSGFGRIAAEDAYRATLRQKASKWPDRASGKIEPVCLPRIAPSFAIRPGATVFTIGSCFARHIELALDRHGLTVPTLAFSVPKAELWAGTGMVTGILNKYTPLSMLNEVEQAAGAETDDGRRFLIETADGLFWDGQLHTTEAVTLERGLRRRARIRQLYADAIRSSDVVIVTLGLIEAWWDEAAQVYLNDTAPKALVDRYPGRFLFETLPIDKTIDAVLRLATLLREMNPSANMLLTVSPVPFARSFSGGDAITANAYSKASLRVAAEVVSRACDWVDYYPSYESVTQSERATAWEDDLVHVRLDLVEANVSRMVADYVEAAA